MFLNQISKLTFGIGISIIVSASFARQIADFAKANLGEKGFTVLLEAIFVISVLSFLIFIIKKSSNFIKIIVFITVLTIGIVLAWQIKIAIEKIHILEYAILGWSAGRDLIKTNKKIKGAILACIFCIIVGILDERFQAILPYRVYDLRDIVFNSLGGAWGVILYLLS